MNKPAAAEAQPDVRPTPAIQQTDEMAAALDQAEGVQRRALEEARYRVQQAVTALGPFEKHEGRIMPGIERAVKEERVRLGISLENLAKIAGLHLEKLAEDLEEEMRRPALMVGRVTDAGAVETAEDLETVPQLRAEP